MQASPRLLWIFFFLYVGIAVLFVLNMFIAIVTHFFHEVCPLERCATPCFQSFRAAGASLYPVSRSLDAQRAFPFSDDWKGGPPTLPNMFWRTVPSVKCEAARRDQVRTLLQLTLASLIEACGHRRQELEHKYSEAVKVRVLNCIQVHELMSVFVGIQPNLCQEWRGPGSVSGCVLRWKRPLIRRYVLWEPALVFTTVFNYCQSQLCFQAFTSCAHCQATARASRESTLIVTLSDWCMHTQIRLCVRLGSGRLPVESRRLEYSAW
jgi:hypothetical protein